MTEYIYLKLKHAHHSRENSAYLIEGQRKISSIAQEKFNRNISQLDSQNLETVLQEFSGTSEGDRWVQHLLLLIVEATLSDPVYLANKNQKGWSWLKPHIGFPRPKIGTRYFEL